MRRYGTDKPDLRVPLVIEEVSDLVAQGAISFLQSSATDPAIGGVVRGLRVPGGASSSRKQGEGGRGGGAREGGPGGAPAPPLAPARRGPARPPRPPPPRAPGPGASHVLWPGGGGGGASPRLAARDL